MFALQEFVCRQDRVLAQCEANSVCVIPAASLATRSNDTEYVFRQDSDFWYLTGFDEPDAWLLLSNHERHHGRFTAMVVQDKDPTAEIWTGRRLGAEAAIGRFDLDEAYELTDLDMVLLEWLEGHDHVYFAQGHKASADEKVQSTLARLRSQPKQYHTPTVMHDIRPLLHEMRLFKSTTEIAAMRAAAQISSRAHCRAMTFVEPGKFEYQLEAELHHEFAMSGARSPAYGTIVGSGENARILHYTQNSDEIADGDLILIDAGAEYLGYAADITRTFPANGSFSEAQTALYNLVLDAQQKVLDMLAPGVTLPQAMEVASEIICTGLVELGILSGSLADNLENNRWQRFFMHGIGHYLGLDVHDAGSYKEGGEARVLKPGMVITVEPGVYIPCESDIPDAYQGIGIRIEDNVVITATGIDILTDDVPKTIEGIEALMRKGNA